ncbi:hypothetical protein [Hyphomonas sp.]|uniref:hypothetical protein n=1 Tax=Hyphomonas sp. TaxID=87 RepID=UPI0025BC893F|nr:hypothetical protein [Hyphomonas sp.]
MSFGGGPSGFNAIKALVDSSADFRAVADKDWAAAAGLIVKKLMIAAGQTGQSLIALRAAVGDEIFEAQLKSLSHHQAKLLAKRLDKSVADLEVSTARAAIGHIRSLLVPAPVVEEKANEPEAEAAATDPVTDETETVTEPPTDDTPPASPNPYFGRKSFRTG